ncbi:hypothetical protein TcWFU_001769 [Taenia crassiceps]|uniref:CST complex subunit CTC1 n=1 Tax=Taenia crassiceps TaxID=6207 RepID=A0ABR4PZU0_9CEST
MHQRVRFHGLNRATLFSGQLNETKVWCYVPERSALEVLPISSEVVPSSIHVCPNWPSNLLPCVDLIVTSSYRRFCAVECHGCSIDVRRGAFLNTHSFSPSSLPTGIRIRVFGLWVFGTRYLQPGIFTSWRSEDGSFAASSPSIHLETTSPVESALRLALMTIFLITAVQYLASTLFEERHLITGSLCSRSYFSAFNFPLTPPSDEIDSEYQEKASLWTESAFNALFDNVRGSELPPAIHFADKFIRLHEYAPSSDLDHLLLTTGDLGGVSSVFHSPKEPINLSGRMLQFFEPRATPKEIILIGRLGMNVATGALMIGPIFGSKQSATVPLLLLSPSSSDLGKQSLLNEVVLIRRPRLVVAVSSDATSTVCAFGKCLTNIPHLCVICDTTLKCLSVDTVGASDSLSLPSAEMVTEPILLRYVSSPTDPPTSFSIRYECAVDGRGNSDGPSSSSLHCLELRSSAALWAFARGLFNTGHRIHLCCVCDGGRGPQVVSEPRNAPCCSDCHHLVGLYHWRILSVREVQDLLKSDSNCDRQRHRKWISIQGYVFRHKLCAPGSNGRLGIRLWLIDRYSLDPSASSPLRIDLLAPSSTETRAITDLSRLPCLTHVCLFKVCLRGERLLLPFSRNHLQISPNGFYSYFSADASRRFCSCFSGTVNSSVCSVCTMDASMRTTIGVAPSLELQRSMDLLCEPERRKTCLVHIIRCLRFRVFRLGESVSIHLKILISDGSATGVASFNCEHPSRTLDCLGAATTPSLHWLMALLGLEESLTRQVLTHLMTVSENVEDAKRTLRAEGRLPGV